MVKQTKPKFSLGLSKKFLLASTLSSAVLAALLGTGANLAILHAIADILPFAKRGFIIEPVPLFLALHVLIPVVAVWVLLLFLNIRRPLLIALIVGIPIVFLYTIVINSYQGLGSISVFLLAWVIFFVIREMVKEKPST